MAWLHRVYGWMDLVLGLSLKSEALGFSQMTARAVVMYVVLIVLVRSGKKRFLAGPTAFDFILVIIIGSIAARAITGGAPFFVAIVALAALVFMHWIISAIARDSRFFSGLVKGHPTLLVRDGKIDHTALRAAHMSDDDLDEDLRSHGVADARTVAEGRLERSGELSVIKKSAK